VLARETLLARSALAVGVGTREECLMERVAIRLMVVLSLFVASCGGSQGGGGSGGTSGAVCIPGASSSCTCTTGGMGAQVCNASGSGFGVCTCSGPGTGGSAGTTGVAGTNGSAGTPGSGGRGGTTTSMGGTTGAGGSDGGKAGNIGGPNIDAGTSTDGNVSSSSDGGGTYTGRWVSVQIIDAIIAPGKADGTAWDGTVPIPDSVLNALGTALAGGDPVGGSLAVLAGPDLNNAISSFDKPDAYGLAQATVFGVTGDAYSLAQPTEAVEDNYTPIWPDVWRYVNVPIDSDVRILVSLWDSDLVNDDPIGAAEINSADLMNALAAQRKYEVRVEDQTDGQLLFIGISVVQQSGLM
jgi:hypothetical protein